MYKTILEYGRINKNMKVKFNLILKDDNPKFRGKLIDKFNLNGVDYLKLSPHPFLTIDISSAMDRGESWSSNKTMTLNQMGVFSAKRAIRESLRALHTEDLFMYVNDKLVINRELANEVTVKFSASNKHILITPVVIYDDDDPTSEYEGLCLMINTVDNFCNLTIEEAEYLYDMLDKINLMQIALNVINTSILLKSTQSKQITIERVISEKPEIVETTINFNPTKPDSEIPEI